MWIDCLLLRRDLLLDGTIWSLLQSDKASGEAWHGLEIFNDSLRAQVLMLEDSYCIVVSKKNQFNAVDDGDVTFVNHKIVVGITLNRLSFDNILWVNPLVGKFHRMSRRHQETTFKSAKLCCTIECFSFDNTLDSSSFTVRCGDQIMLLELFY